jgi:hypothetical protein
MPKLCAMLLGCFVTAGGYAQGATSTTPATCESRAAVCDTAAAEKKLSGAVKMSFTKKCVTDALAAKRAAWRPASIFSR